MRRLAETKQRKNAAQSMLAVFVALLPALQVAGAHTKPPTSASTPTPRSTRCSIPGVVPHGSWSRPPNPFQSEFSAGETAALTCDPGFRADPTHATLACSALGIWTGSTGAKCASSPPPPPPGTCSGDAVPSTAHGTWDGPTIIFGEQVVVLQCDPPFMVSGTEEQLVCQPDGWPTPTATCVAASNQLCNSCSNAEELQICSDAINGECCDEPTEDCSSGEPASCNAGCKAVLVPIQAMCEEYLNSVEYLAPVRAALSSAASKCPRFSPIPAGGCVEMAQYLDLLPEMSKTCCGDQLDPLAENNCMAGYPFYSCSADCADQISRLNVGCAEFLQSELGLQMSPPLLGAMGVCAVASTLV